MKGGWTIGRLAGIDLRLHFTFPLILALGAFQWGSAHGVGGAFFGVVLMLALFACVALHELGHALAARHYGIATREILLSPLGGIAFLARAARRPIEELVIALAGPAVNVAIAMALALLIGVAPAALPAEATGLLRADEGGPSLGTFLHWLLGVNISLVLFNLLPAFPMDGGRVLRALLAFRFGWLRGTRWAAAVGQGLAVAGGAWALFSGQLLLAVVAVFVFLGAGQERTHAEARHVLESLRLADVYNRHAIVLGPEDRLSRVVQHLLTSYQPDFAVFGNGRLLGVVTRERVLAIAALRHDDPPVAEWLEPRVPALRSSTTLEEAQELLSAAATSCGAVVEGGRYLGLVSLQDLAEATAIAAALGSGRDRRMGAT
ncbi:MAG: site-2 protease family protein [Holophagales bacterium]|nr:MAG: site-2 protease family protein [Holophagales bacterium]